MLVITTKDDINNHYFLSFEDEGDTKKDFDVTRIMYKTWVMNTSKDMMGNNNAE